MNCLNLAITVVRKCLFFNASSFQRNPSYEGGTVFIYKPGYDPPKMMTFSAPNSFFFVWMKVARSYKACSLDRYWIFSKLVSLLSRKQNPTLKNFKILALWFCLSYLEKLHIQKCWKKKFLITLWVLTFKLAMDETGLTCNDKQHTL